MDANRNTQIGPQPAQDPQAGAPAQQPQPATQSPGVKFGPAGQTVHLAQRAHSAQPSQPVPTAPAAPSQGNGYVPPVQAQQPQPQFAAAPQPAPAAQTATAEPRVIPEIRPSGQGGQLVTVPGQTSSAATAKHTVRRLASGSGVEKIGFWIIVAAAMALLLVMLGLLLPPIVGGLISGAYTGLFVGGLTLLNLQRPSGYANTVLGRHVFPVVHATDREIWRLAVVNAGLTLLFTFAFAVVAHFLGALLGGLIVLGGITAAGIFYNRTRRVITNP